jgi:catechol 2,3-dioxygenase-like lactoylglutathione lyase family enzyme
MPDAAAVDSRVKVGRVIHTIHAVAELAACRARYLDILGGLIFAEGYFEAEDRDMALLYVADHMLEPMAPRDASRLEKHFARYLHRYGPGFHSFEIKIEDGPAVAAKLKASGCKLSAEYGFFFYVRQESTGGVLLEVCDRPMPNDPYDRRSWRPDLAEGHPTTLLRLDHIACVTPDVGAALAFFTGQLDGELLADERIFKPQPGRRALVRLADTQVAFLQPDDPSTGPLGAFLTPPTSGVYALVWRVEDEAAAQTFFKQKGLRTTREDCVSAGFAIDPRDFLAARHEFLSASGSL